MELGGWRREGSRKRREAGRFDAEVAAEGREPGPRGEGSVERVAREEDAGEGEGEEEGYGAGSSMMSRKAAMSSGVKPRSRT